MKAIIATGEFEKCRQYITVVGEMRVIGQLVFIGTRIVIPSKLWPRTLALAHKNHLAVVGTKHRTSGPRCGGQRCIKQLGDISGLAMGVSW